MHHALKLHPDSLCHAVTRIDVGVVRPHPGTLELLYCLSGIRDLVIPPVVKPARADELWRHTCFEAFLRPVPGEAYYEFNFSPSMQWAAYRFSAYRSGMRAVDTMDTPRIEVRPDGACFELRVSLDVSGLPADSTWRLGLSAVIEETGGHKSYWALAHPPGKADFHHTDCFALELPAAWRA